jgi:hypothetical protein
MGYGLSLTYDLTPITYYLSPLTLCSMPYALYSLPNGLLTTDATLAVELWPSSCC